MFCSKLHIILFLGIRQYSCIFSKNLFPRFLTLWDMEESSLFSRKNQTILVAFYLQPATCNLLQLVKSREILKTQIFEQIIPVCQ